LEEEAALEVINCDLDVGWNESVLVDRPQWLLRVGVEFDEKFSDLFKRHARHQLALKVRNLNHPVVLQIRSVERFRLGDAFLLRT
jgi:hypothetical protein